MFKKAVKTEAKLRLAIAGPSGSGKTYSALAIAGGLGDKIAVVDTEHGSASKYADIFEFDAANLSAPYSPDKYIDAIKFASSAGYDILIIDSLSHAWFADGGVLDIVDKAKVRFGGNSHYAWAEGTPAQNRLIEAILAADLHVIATMRSKEKYVERTDSKGRKTYHKAGAEPVQREGVSYEFDAFFEMDIENRAVVSKTRCPQLTNQVIKKPGEDVANILKDWLSGAPAPTQDEYFLNMISATTLTDWQDNAYQLTAVKNAFNNPKRLEDWRHAVTGNGYDPAQNEQLTQVLMDYCDDVANGVTIKVAFVKAKESMSPSPED